MLGVALVAVPVAIGFSQTSSRIGLATTAPGPEIRLLKVTVANWGLADEGRVDVPTPKFTPTDKAPGEASRSIRPSMMRWIGTEAFPGPSSEDGKFEVAPVENIDAGMVAEKI